MDVRNLELEIGLLHEKVCTALGDTTRIMMLYLLAEKAMCVNEISETLNIPQPTASRHLKVLRERDLVNTERQGTNVEYSLADTRIIQALNLMRDLLTERIQAQAVITGSQTMVKQPKLKARNHMPMASTSSANGSLSTSTGSAQAQPAASTGASTPSWETEGKRSAQAQPAVTTVSIGKTQKSSEIPPSSS